MTQEKAFICAKAAIDKKAENVKILDVSHSGFTDYFVICSGLSDRQLQAITHHVSESMKANGFQSISSEGYTEGRWILLDFADVVVHVFLDALREYYDIESLWADAPRIKVPSEFYSPAATRLN
jgi:ribosome-associated protein